MCGQRGPRPVTRWGGSRAAPPESRSHCNAVPPRAQTRASRHHHWGLVTVRSHLPCAVAARVSTLRMSRLTAMRKSESSPRDRPVRRARHGGPRVESPRGIKPKAAVAAFVSAHPICYRLISLRECYLGFGCCKAGRLRSAMSGAGAGEEESELVPNAAALRTWLFRSSPHKPA